jgi:hypothetical protein
MEYMMEDDDIPPMLVESAPGSKANNELMEIEDGLVNLSMVKVPITIVTGTSSNSIRVEHDRQLDGYVYCLPGQIFCRDL